MLNSGVKRIKSVSMIVKVMGVSDHGAIVRADSNIDVSTRF